MRICVYGAGAIGGHMAMRFHLAGAEVSILARGETLAAIRADGLRMDSGKHSHVAHLPVADEPEDLPAPDVIVVAVKSQGLSAIAGRLARLSDGRVPLVFALNGLPWWYRRMLRSDAAASPPDAGSDEAALSAVLSPELVIGCTVASTNSLRARGHVLNEMPSPNRYVFGTVAPTLAPLCDNLADLITRGGGTGQASDDIAFEIWKKLQLNLITNSFGCLTGLDSRALLASPTLQPLAERMLTDTRAIAAACGVTLPQGNDVLDHRPIPAHKTSMLQDLEKGTPLEFDAVFGAALDVARWQGVDVPALSFAAGLLRAKAERLGLVGMV